MMNRKQWACCVGLAAFALGEIAMAAARLPFRDGFESGNFSAWGGGLETTMSVNCRFRNLTSSALTRSRISPLLASSDNSESSWQ